MWGSKKANSRPAADVLVGEERALDKETWLGLEILVTSWFWLVVDDCLLRAPWKEAPLLKVFTTSICNGAENETSFFNTPCNKWQKNYKKKQQHTTIQNRHIAQTWAIHQHDIQGIQCDLHNVIHTVLSNTYRITGIILETELKTLPFAHAFWHVLRLTFASSALHTTFVSSYLGGRT